MIINVRGTSGSGKSHLVRRIMELYPIKNRIFTEGRKQPVGYWLRRSELQEKDRPLFVVGHYETACGGGDTITAGIEEVYRMVRQAIDQGNDVMYEGLIVQNDAARCIELCQKNPNNHIVILLSTPIDECLASVQARRAERGNDKPLNPTNTEKSFKSTLAQRSRFRDAGVNWQHLGREQAFEVSKRLLGLL
jgi:thymidylate kinase